MLKILIVGAAAMVLIIPSSLIAQWRLRLQGKRVPLFEAGPAYMEVAPAPAKVALIGLNFTLVGLAIWLIFW